MNTNYSLSIETRGVAVRMDVNDVPMWSHSGSGQKTRLLNPWIVQGENMVSLAIDWPENMPYSPGLAEVVLRIEAQPAGTTGSVGRTIAELRWPGTEPEAYPGNARVTIPIADPPPSRLWTSAAPIRLTPQSQQEIAGLVERLHEALAVRSVERAAELLEFRTLDVGQSYYASAVESRLGQRAALEAMLASDAEDELQPLYLNALEFHPVAGGRVIWVTGPEREAAITWRDEDCVSRMPLYVAPIDGAWTIVR